MSLQDDIAALVKQEAALTLPAFTPDTAWQLGTMLRDMALTRRTPIVVDIRRFGAPHQQLFYTALAGTTPDNQRWVTRKIATVARFHKSSYHIGRLLEQSGLSFSARYNLPEEEYAAHGGCFPLIVENAGIVGAVTVSGLPQRDDHNIVVEALCQLTNRDHAALKLPPEATDN
ncbi:MAG TPA: heme-degrading domain-containing protein [Acidobacteriaceae bacterium]|nr:heme-degrading domain-containing protein [Acidobacteriaceae bacterium]